MTRFIRFRTTAGNHVLLNVDSISSVSANPELEQSHIVMRDTSDQYDAVIVDHSIDEIQTAIEDGMELVECKPVRRPEFNPGEFNL